MARFPIRPRAVDAAGRAVAGVIWTLHEYDPASPFFTRNADGGYTVPDPLPASIPMYDTPTGTATVTQVTSSVDGKPATTKYVDYGLYAMVGKIGTRTHVEVVNTQIHQVATRSELATRSDTCAIYLRETGRTGWFLPITGDQTANIDRDPLQGVYVAGANGVTWRRDCNESTLMASWFGAKDDRDVNPNGVVAAEGADTTPILKAVVDFISPSESGYLPDTGSMATHGAAELVFVRSLEGTGRFNFKDGVVGRPIVEMPGDKNLVLRSPAVQTISLECSGVADWLIRYMPGSHGRSVGARDLQIVGAGFDVVGGNRGQHLLFNNVKAVQTREAALRTIDLNDTRIAANAADYYSERGEVAPSANRNVTQFEIHNFEAYQCFRQYHFAATTHSKGSISKSRAYASERTPVLIEDDGYVFNGYEFLGVNSANHATDAFIQILPGNGSASDILFRDVRFGGEDTNQGGTIYEPPHVNVLIGTSDKNAYDDSLNVARFKIEGQNLFQGAGHNNANVATSQVEHGILINCRSSSIEVSGTASGFSESFIHEGSAANEMPTIGGCKIDVSQSDAAPLKLFSHGGRGWQDANDVFKAEGAARTLNKGMDELDVGNWVTTRLAVTRAVTADGENPYGEEQNHFVLTTDNQGTPGAVSLRCNMFRPMRAGKRYCIVVWAKARSGDTIGFDVVESGSTDNVVLNSADIYQLSDSWRRIVIPLGVMTYSADKTFHLRVHLPSYAGSSGIEHPADGESIQVYRPSVFEGDVAPDMPLFNPHLGANNRFYNDIPPHLSSMIAGHLHVSLDAIPTSTSNIRWYPFNTLLTLPDGTQHKCTVAGAPGTWVAV